MSAILGRNTLEINSLHSFGTCFSMGNQSPLGFLPPIYIRCCHSWSTRDKHYNATRFSHTATKYEKLLSVLSSIPIMKLGHVNNLITRLSKLHTVQAVSDHGSQGHFRCEINCTRHEIIRIRLSEHVHVCQGMQVRLMGIRMWPLLIKCCHGSWS